MPDMSTNQFEKYSKKIEDALQDNIKAHQAFINACGLIDKVLNGNYNRDHAKSSRFVNDIKNAI